jgi:2-hydroxy-6-oxonona-2,4-dienedioate hydrolase
MRGRPGRQPSKKAGPTASPIDVTPAQSLAQTEARAQRSVTAAGTVWRRWGDNNSRAPLVLLHGGAGSWAHWIRNIDALAADRPLWIPDLPGLGESVTPPGPRDHTAVANVLARDAEELLPGAAFDLVGFSFGGIVAAFLASLRPQRVRRLILVGAGGLGLRKGEAKILKPWLGLKDPAEREAAHRHNLGALMLSTPGRIDPLSMHLYTRDLVRARVNSAKSSRAEPLKQQLESLRMPIDGIWGRLDITAHGKFDEIRALLRGAYPDAQLKIIEDAGHWVQYEQAAAFNTVLPELLAAHRMPGTP